MNTSELATIFQEVRNVLSGEDDATKAWLQVLSIAGCAIPALSAVDVRSDVKNVIQEVQHIVAIEPLPKDLSFIYFGLFDVPDVSTGGKGKQTGFYISGGVGSPQDALDRGDLSYFPAHRVIRSELLRSVTRLAREYPECQGVLDYAVQFGAAAILAKSASQYLGGSLPIYVGFDAGDYALIVTHK